MCSTLAAELYYAERPIFYSSVIPQTPASTDSTLCAEVPAFSWGMAGRGRTCRSGGHSREDFTEEVALAFQPCCLWDVIFLFKKLRLQTAK